MTRKDRAADFFKNDHNCAQSVLLSFADFLGREEDELRAVAAGFGGGMGMQQLTCGAVTGAYMVLSIYASGVEKEWYPARNLAGELIREFSARFKTSYGPLSCRELIGVDITTEEGQKQAKERNVFGEVCTPAVVGAVEILEDLLPREES